MKKEYVQGFDHRSNMIRSFFNLAIMDCHLTDPRPLEKKLERLLTATMLQLAFDQCEEDRRQDERERGGWEDIELAQHAIDAAGVNDIISREVMLMAVLHEQRN